MKAPVDRSRARRIWFYREYVRLTGGHLKHSHYFGHTQRMPGFAPVITFGGKVSPTESRARERRRLWPARSSSATAEHWAPGDRDVLFLAGVDWRYLIGNGLEALGNPRINLIQGMRHAHAGTELYRYLSEKAVRICVSREVADAVSATGRTRGPVLIIPNGVDVAPFEPTATGSPIAYDTRRSGVTIVGYKRPDLARNLSHRLEAEHIEHRLLTEFLDRHAFLALLAESRVAVCLPYVEEGFYLPAIEAMASGAIVVTLDCIGNRSFCRHEDNCLVAEHNPASLLSATRSALALSAPAREHIHQRARETAADHSLAAERARFQAILNDIDRLWRMA